MARLENPIVLVTRPAEGAKQFVSELEQAAGRFQPLIAPAFELERVDYAAVPFDTAIFTSAAGVRFAENGEGRLAWCVGDGTAAAARGKGYSTRVGPGNAEDLVKLILMENMGGKLLHFRGENVRINVTEMLSDADLNCSEVMTYRKSVHAPPDEILKQVPISTGFILPAFSGETVSIIEAWPLNFEGARVIAISQDVATAAARLNPSHITSADHSNLKGMIQATSRLIA